MFQMYVMLEAGSLKPAVWFRYDLSPITVKYIEKRKPFYSFVTTVSFIALFDALPCQTFCYVKHTSVTPK